MPLSDTTVWGNRETAHTRRRRWGRSWAPARRGCFSPRCNPAAPPTPSLSRARPLIPPIPLISRTCRPSSPDFSYAAGRRRSPVAVPTTRKEIAVLTTHLAAPDTGQFAALAGILSIPLDGLIMLIAGLVQRSRSRREPPPPAQHPDMPWRPAYPHHRWVDTADGTVRIRTTRRPRPPAAALGRAPSRCAVPAAAHRELELDHVDRHRGSVVGAVRVWRHRPAFVSRR